MDQNRGRGPEGQDEEFEAQRVDLLLGQAVLNKLPEQQKFWLRFFLETKEGDIGTRLTEIFNVQQEKDKVFLLEELEESLDTLITFSIDDCINYVFREDPTMQNLATTWKDDADVFSMLSLMALEFRKGNFSGVKELEPELFALLSRKEELEKERKISSPEETSLAMQLLIEHLPTDFSFSPINEETRKLQELADRLGVKVTKALLKKMASKTSGKPELSKLVNRLRGYLGLR